MFVFSRTRGGEYTASPAETFTARSPRKRSMWHAVEFRNRVEAGGPCLLRANKYLPAWDQFISLAQQSNPYVIVFWLIAIRCRIERRPTSRAEALRTDVSAVGSLSVFRRFARQEHERAWTRDNNCPQWSAAHCLTICAVANGRRFGIGFGLKRHVAAMAASINFHGWGRPLAIAALPEIRATEQAQCSLDDFIRAHEHRWRNAKAEHVCGLRVYCQFELGGLLDREVLRV